MDNGPREKEMANNIKQIVKYTSRRKGRLAGLYLGQNNSGITEAPTINLAPKPANSSSKNRFIITEDVDHQKSSPDSSSAQSSAQSASAGITMGLAPDSLNNFIGTPSISGNEAALLMHFLDNVFPLQYPMYKPDVAEGGRGWLLSLLLKTKPLYHASIGLSAYHRGVDAIRYAQISIDQSSMCPENGLGIMACSVQLVFFELFGVHKSSWEIHLRAATDLFAQGYRKHAAELGLLVNNETTFNTFPVAYESRDSEHSIIFLFLFGVVIWLDIVSCVNTGKSPHLLDLHPLAFDSKAQIKLENIMGCKNWVMTELGRISMLHSSKGDQIQGGIFDAHSFENQAEHIRQTIRRGLNEQFLTDLRITNADSTSLIKPKISAQEIITRLFSRAAYVYLELVVGGFKRIEENPDLHNIIAEPMMILPTLPRGDLFRAINKMHVPSSL
ncbi:hypothetical protein DID88_008646 [Monilinia fructigena]|uniref:Transcription factor domain-containing protein n=1 Tax=Monilinia fructigena TaxID=38457 RepID=A0A395J6F4_9HELO|nr:hypothetical protein DID88_008646 [Monilinia fructigena]